MLKKIRNRDRNSSLSKDLDYLKHCRPVKIQANETYKRITEKISIKKININKIYTSDENFDPFKDKQVNKEKSDKSSNLRNIGNISNIFKSKPIINRIKATPIQFYHSERKKDIVFPSYSEKDLPFFKDKLFKHIIPLHRDYDILTDDERIQNQVNICKQDLKEIIDECKKDSNYIDINLSRKLVYKKGK